MRLALALLLAPALSTSARAGDWVVEVVDIVGSGNAATSFTPASGEQSDPISGFLDSVGAGRMLTPAEEEVARATGWKRAE